ncbi:MAG: hypothetical protein GF398_18655 [Chitinivibrionales bacterium]|nr:hypothetical protein [Chitinivibrionales bacterium]
MKNLCITAILLFIANSTLPAETRISGNIDKMVFEKVGNPHIVEQDIIVPAGEEVTIEKGTVFLFKPFTGLHVHGTLIIEGTSDEYVIFTSIHDAEFNPNSKQMANPFDWNGILIAREAGKCRLKNFLLSFSVFGIKAHTSNINITSGIFRQNGQFHFTINDEIQYVQDNIPYSHNPDKNVTSHRQDEAAAGASTNKKPEEPKKDRSSPSHQKKIFRYTSLGIGVAGVALGATMTAIGVQKNSEWNDWAASYQFQRDSLNLSEEEYGEKFDRLEKQQNNSILVAIVSGIIGVAGFTGFTLTFVF